MREAQPPAATWRKLGVREGDRVVLLRAPASWSSDALEVTALVARRRVRTPADVVVTFVTSRRTLVRDAEALVASIAVDGMAWVAWPRKAAGHVSDLSDEVVRSTMLELGVVDVKVAQLDEDWSGLKVVWRRSRRGAASPGAP